MDAGAKTKVLAGLAVLVMLLALTTWLGVRAVEADVGIPHSLQVQSLTSSTISIGWSATASLCYRFEVEYKRSTYSSWTNGGFASSHSYSASNLSSATTYNFRVRGQTAHAEHDDDGDLFCIFLTTGYTDWSSTLTATTKSTVPNRVTLSSNAQTPNNITLSWGAPYSGGSAITGYEMQYRLVGDVAWTTWPDAIASDVRSLTVAGLLVGRAYQFQARAVNNLGNGPWSYTFTQSTKDPPEQVAGLILTSSDKTRLSILWQQPPSQETITGYQVEYRKNTGDSSAAWTQLTTTSSVVSLTVGDVTALSAGTAYEIRVRAVSSEGDGDWSETLFAETKADLFAAAAPDKFTLTQLDSSPPYVVVSLKWDELDEAEGYQVERKVDGVVSIYDTTDLYLENTYDNTADEHGELVYRVRAKRTVDGADNYSPWSAPVTLLFFGSGTIAVDRVLRAEIDGNRQLDPEVADMRTRTASAIDQLTEPSGLTVDTAGLMNLLSAMPGMLLFGTALFSGLALRTGCAGLRRGLRIIDHKPVHRGGLPGFSHHLAHPDGSRRRHRGRDRHGEGLRVAWKLRRVAITTMALVAFAALAWGFSPVLAYQGVPGPAERILAHPMGQPQESDPPGMTMDEFIDTTPGGPWMPQLLVSFLATGMMLWMFRLSVAGLLIAAIMMPVSAFGMAVIGYGNYWLPTIEGVLLGLAFLGWRFLTRRTI